MDFKISSYVAYSQRASGKYSNTEKRVVFSCRTGQGLIVTNYLFEKLLTGDLKEVLPSPVSCITNTSVYSKQIPCFMRTRNKAGGNANRKLINENLNV